VTDRWLLPVLFVVMTAGCGDDAPGSPDADDSPDADTTPPATYEFPSRYDSARSSVAYDGQVARLTWIVEMSRWIDVVNADVSTGGVNRAAGDVIRELDVYYRYDATFADVPVLLTLTPPIEPAQRVMGGLSTSANLRGKLAGLDSDAATVMYKDWSTGLEGWSGISAPDALVQAWIALLDAAAAGYNPEPPRDPAGNAIAKVHVTPAGLDLRELLQKFLLGAVALSQGADDYLDDATPDKGLLTPNTRDGDHPWTRLEHTWDEGFGYFGAPRDYGSYPVAELAATAHHDSDDNGYIDLGREYVTGAAGNAAKRDLGAVVPTDFARRAWEAFVAGRQLIASVDGELSPDQQAELRGYRDAAVAAWEQAIAATVVHYINDVLGHMTDDTYSFTDHAKHWSEMKGFALSFQFNPRSPMREQGRFATFHALVGDAPVLMNAGATALEAYRRDLREARSLLGAAYGFAAANLGDDQGQGGW
jgi:hypothetical protein